MSEPDDKQRLETWAAKQALAILAVDNIKLSASGQEILKRREDDLITREQGLQEIREKAFAMVAKRPRR